MTRELAEHVVPSAGLGDRRVRVLPPVDDGSAGLLVLLDGEFYAERMPTTQLIAEGQRSGRLESFWTLFVDAGDQPTRWRDCQCSEEFATFVGHDLLTWFGTKVADVETFAIGGLSLSGLQAAFTAVVQHRAFARVFAQSPSFWWSDGWFADFCDSTPRSILPSMRMRVGCGLDETADDVDHGPGLHQTMSQLAGCRLVRDVCIRRDIPIEYAEIPGGHDFDTWTRDLPDCLEFVFGRES